MREFYLLNGNGIKFDLMGSKGFFHAPDGLGFDKTETFLRTGDFYRAVESYPTQKMITGEMIFRSYADYHDFALFVAITPLTLVYKPMGTEYKLDCSMSSLGKSEIDHTNNRLICPVTFNGYSKWYLTRRTVASHPMGQNGKVYTFGYNYNYYDSYTGVMDLINESPTEAPCMLYIRGYCRNPFWALSVNNKTIMSGKVTAEIEEGNQLIVNSRDDSLEIAKYTNQGVYIENLYQKADVERENFLYIPTGTSKLTITDDGLNEITAYLEVIEEYDTV